MSASPRRRYLLLALAVAVLVMTAAPSRLHRDRAPPEVVAELPEVVSAGLAFTVRLGADEPVRYRVAYEDQSVESYQEVTGDVTLELLGVLGTRELSVVAADAAGNESRYSYSILALPELKPLLAFSQRVAPGDPVAIHIDWAPTGHGLESLSVYLGGEALTVFRGADGATALTGIPLGAEPGEREVRVTVGDRYGREATVTRSLSVGEETRPLQTLKVPAGTLSVATPENQAREAETLEAVYESSAYRLAPLWREPFILPAEGRSSSPYGSPRRYAAGGAVSYHHGTDIAAPEGTPVLAANDGKVVVSGFYPIRGGLIVIDHGAGVHSLYFHQSRLYAGPGGEVRRGEVIGEVGSTGLSTGPHLHWEMRVGGVSTDPLRWVDKVWP